MAHFTKSERLHSKSEIETLFRDGESFFVFPYKIVYVKREKKSNSPVQILISVPKKLHKTAVARNRVKRLTREAYRLNKHLLLEQMDLEQPGFNIAFIYVDKNIGKYQTIEKTMKKVLLKFVSVQNSAI